MTAGKEKNTYWLSWLGFLAGLWLIISPFFLGYSQIEVAANNDLIVGVIVGLLALTILMWKQSALWLSWVIVLIGVWEIVAPILIGYVGTPLALVNALVIGLLLIISAGWRVLSLQENVTLIQEFGPSFHLEERPKKSKKASTK